MNLDLTRVPWWGTIILALISALGGYLTTHRASKDKMQSDLVAQTVIRQNKLDQRQEKMMDELQTEINRLKDDLLLVRKELSDERTANRALEDSIEVLRKENIMLKAENTKLQAEIGALKSALSMFEKCDVAKCDKLVRREG